MPRFNLGLMSSFDYLFFFPFKSELFKVVHSLLLCHDSREPCLNYIAEIIKRNHKKAQLQVNSIFHFIYCIVLISYRLTSILSS